MQVKKFVGGKFKTSDLLVYLFNPSDVVKFYELSEDGFLVGIGKGELLTFRSS